MAPSEREFRYRGWRDAMARTVLTAGDLETCGSYFAAIRRDLIPTCMGRRRERSGNARPLLTMSHGFVTQRANARHLQNGCRRRWASQFLLT